MPSRPQKVRVDRATEKVKKKRDSPRVFRLDIVVSRARIKNGAVVTIAGQDSIWCGVVVAIEIAFFIVDTYSPILYLFSAKLLVGLIVCGIVVIVKGRLITVHNCREPV